VSDLNPAETSAALPHVVAEQFDEDSNDAASPSTPTKKPEREGLPPGYRMRADSHYVDLITSRRADRVQADPARGSRRGDARTQEAGAETADRAEARARSGRILAQLTEDLATIESAASLLASDASRMARRANIDVIRAQTWRAAWLLRASAILDGSHRAPVKPRPLGFLLGQIRGGFAPECRLAHVALDVSASDWNAIVPVDEAAFIAGLTGALVATMGLIGEPDDSRLTVHAVTSGHELRSVEVSQQEIAVSSDVGARFFDPLWIDRPGGWSAALGAALTRVVAQQHGGDAILLPGDRMGSTVRLNFSA
jgi:hypothetical protein